MHSKYPGWHVQVQTVMGEWIDAPPGVFRSEMLRVGGARDIRPYVDIRAYWSRFGWENAKVMMGLGLDDQMATLIANLAIEKARKA